MKKILFLFTCAFLLLAQPCFAQITIYKGNYDNYLKLESVNELQLSSRDKLIVTIYRDATFTKNKKGVLEIFEDRQFQLQLVSARKKLAKGEEAFALSKKNLPSLLINRQRHEFKDLFTFNYTDGKTLRAQFLKGTEKLLLNSRSLKISFPLPDEKELTAMVGPEVINEWNLILSKDMRTEYENAFLSQKQTPEP